MHKVKLIFGLGLERNSLLFCLNRTRREFCSLNSLLCFPHWDYLSILHLVHPHGVLDPTPALWGTWGSLVLWKQKCSSWTKIIKLASRVFWQKIMLCDIQKVRENELIVPAGVVTLDDNHEPWTLVTCYGFLPVVLKSKAALLKGEKTELRQKVLWEKFAVLTDQVKINTCHYFWSWGTYQVSVKYGSYKS